LSKHAAQEAKMKIALATNDREAEENKYQLPTNHWAPFIGRSIIKRQKCQI